MDNTQIASELLALASKILAQKNETTEKADIKKTDDKAVAESGGGKMRIFPIASGFNELAARRKKTGLSQPAFSKASGIALGAIRRLESGDTVRISTIHRYKGSLKAEEIRRKSIY